VRSTKQSVGIIVGGFCPQHLLFIERLHKLIGFFAKM
jgi:hypothetical protein